MAELHVEAVPDLTAAEQDVYFIEADSLRVAELRPNPSAEGEWILRSVRPASFHPVPIEADDLSQALASAGSWVHRHFRRSGSSGKAR